MTCEVAARKRPTVYRHLPPFMRPKILIPNERWLRLPGIATASALASRWRGRSGTLPVVTMDRERILIAPDKFKGSLSALEVAAALERGLRRRRGQLIDIDLCPVADGGDGTLDIAISAGFTRVLVDVDGPTGEPVRASYAERAGLAIVELAEAAGIRRLAGKPLAPLAASTFGVGQLVAAALAHGNRTIMLAIGGSATTDGGAGLVQALGARLLNQGGLPLGRGGGALAQIDRVELGDLREHIDGVEFIVASDVDNPLLGPTGAAAVFGPQKGASPEHVDALEHGLSRWAAIIAEATSIQAAEDPGAGAAGGVGFAGIAILNATVISGADMVLKLVRFTDRVRDAVLVITGEGSLDEQTIHGKAPARVAELAQQAGIPVIAVAGRCTLSERELLAAGIRRAYTLRAIEPDLSRSIANAGPLLERVGEQIAERELG
jgi:glycerate kinase